MKEGWGYKKLNELCEVITKGTTPTTLGYTFSEVGINFIKIESISTNRKLLRDKLNHISEECNKSMSRSQLQESDLLFSIAGALGRIYIVEKSVLPANTNQALAIIRLKNKQDLFLRYLSYYLSSNTLKRQIDKDKVGVAQLNLSLSQIKNFVIPIPSIKVQQHIVEELDLLSSIIEKKKAQLKELDNLAQSLFYEMFGDPIINNMEWEVKTLKELVYIGLGFTHTPQYVEKGVPFISVKDISSGYIDLSKIKYVSKEEYDNAPKGAKPQKGDLMFCRVGTMGKPLIVETDMQFCTFVSVGYMRRLQNNIDMSFLKYWMLSNSFDKQVEANVRGLAIKNLNTGWLKNFSIYLPPLSIQQQFAEKVEAIEHQKELIKQSIKEVETLFYSRMDYYFN